MPPTRKGPPASEMPPPADGNADLDEALEETFPASDPISTGAPEGFEPPPAKPSRG